MTKNENFMPSSKTKEEVKAIGEDIKNIFERIGNIKEESMKDFSDDYEQLLDKMYSLKDRMIGKGTVKAIDWYIGRHPVKTALYCIGIGVLISRCFRK